MNLTGAEAYRRDNEANPIIPTPLIRDNPEIRGQMLHF
jgi:hypothetical protein